MQLAAAIFLNLYLVILINNVCRNAFVYHFGEDGWSWGAVLIGSLLCQPHLVTLGAQWSLWVRGRQARLTQGERSSSCCKPSSFVEPGIGWWGSADSPQSPVQQACWGKHTLFLVTRISKFVLRRATWTRNTGRRRRAALIPHNGVRNICRKDMILFHTRFYF